MTDTPSDAAQSVEHHLESRAGDWQAQRDMARPDGEAAAAQPAGEQPNRPRLDQAGAIDDIPTEPL